MAEEKELKRVYNVPLRKGFLKTPKWKRSKKAVKVLKEFLARHMKTDINNVKIGKVLNEHLWKHGIKNPPHHVKVETIKNKEGIVTAELEGHEYTVFKKEKKEEKGALGKVVDKLKGGETKSKETKDEKKLRTKDKIKAKKEQPQKKETKPTEKKSEPKKEQKKEEKTETKESKNKKQETKQDNKQPEAPKVEAKKPQT